MGLTDFYSGDAFTYSYDVVNPNYEGTDKISLSEIISNPAVSLPQMQRNLMNNYQQILVKSFVTSFSFKILRKVLRTPIGKINRGLFGKRCVVGNIGFKV